VNGSSRLPGCSMANFPGRCPILVVTSRLRPSSRQSRRLNDLNASPNLGEAAEHLFARRRGSDRRRINFLSWRSLSNHSLAPAVRTSQPRSLRQPQGCDSPLRLEDSPPLATPAETNLAGLTSEPFAHADLSRCGKGFLDVRILRGAVSQRQTGYRAEPGRWQLIRYSIIPDSASPRLRSSSAKSSLSIPLYLLVFI
jgi:hypothetical protein